MEGEEVQDYGDARWGELARPPAHLMQLKNPDALRVAIFGSAYRGLNVVFRLNEMARGNPGLNIVGVCTDDVINARQPGQTEGGQARVSAHKRLWQYIPPEAQRTLQGWMTGFSLLAGVPVWTGDIKAKFFHEGLLKEWRPDVILSATFGQMIPLEVFNQAPLGTYNFHPSDLARGKYPGGNPFGEMMEAGERTTRMTCHHVDAGIDTGNVVGASQAINIVCSDDTYPQVTRGRQHGGSWVDESMSAVEALHAHTSPFAADMAQILIDEIMAKRSRVDRLNFEERMSKRQKEQAALPPLKPHSRSAALHHLLADVHRMVGDIAHWNPHPIYEGR